MLYMYVALYIYIYIYAHIYCLLYLYRLYLGSVFSVHAQKLLQESSTPKTSVIATVILATEPFDLQFDFHLFLQVTTVTG